MLGSDFDVEGSHFLGQGDWASDCDGCEQHGGKGGELHGGSCRLVGELFVE